MRASIFYGDPAVRDKLDITHIVFREAFGPVIQSQVLKPLSLLGEEVRKRVVLMLPFRLFLNRSTRRKMRQLESTVAESFGVELTHLPSMVSKPKFYYRDSWLLGRWFDRRHLPGTTSILHCRNALAANLAIELKKTRPNLRFVFDCRGAVPAEFLYRRGINEESAGQLDSKLENDYQYLREVEARATYEADHVNTVSNAMVEYLRSRHRDSRNSFSVVPCCVDLEPFRKAREDRYNVRKEHGMEDRFVVCYCGSLEAYQLPDQSLRVFKLIQQHCPRAFFFAITTHPERMWIEIEKAGMDSKQVRVVSAAPKDVPRLLAAADVGLLLRDQSVVNKVASPLKFAEYIAAGVPAVMTPNLGDYSAFAIHNQCGVVVNIENTDEELAEVLRQWCVTRQAEGEAYAKRCFLNAQTHFSWETHRATVSSAYQSIGQSTVQRVGVGS